jgi:hypothetical protein
MASPVNQAKTNAQQKWAGATVYKRGKGSITHVHPTDPNRFMLDSQAGNRGWHFGSEPFDESNEVDTAWQVSQGVWDYEMVKADYNAWINDSVPVTYRYLDLATQLQVDLEIDDIRWVDDNGDLERATDFSQVTPTINDDKITWSEFATGWSIDIFADTARLSKYLNIDTLANLGAPSDTTANPALALQYRFQKSSELDIYINDVLWDEGLNNPQLVNDNIEFRDSGTGNPVFWFKIPIAYDNNGGFIESSQYLRKTGNNLFVEIRVPWAWLETAAYPIIIDPQIDPQVTNTNDDGGYRAGVGFSTASGYLGYRTSPAFGDHEQWCYFATSGLSGATINDSTLDLYNKTGGTPSVTMKIRADDAEAPSPPTTAGEYTGLTLTTAGVDWDFTLVANWNYSVDFASVIQELANDYDPNPIGIIVKNDGTTGDNFQEMADYSWVQAYAAILHIDYTAAGGDSLASLGRLKKRRFKHMLNR